MPRYGYGLGVPVYEAVNQVGQNLRDIVAQNLAQKLELGKMELDGKRLALQGQLAEAALKEQKAKGELAMAQMEDQRRQQAFENQIRMGQLQGQQDYQNRSLGLREQELASLDDYRERQAAAEGRRADAYARTQGMQQQVLNQKLANERKLNQRMTVRDMIQQSPYVMGGLEEALLAHGGDWLDKTTTLKEMAPVFQGMIQKHPGMALQSAYDKGVNQLAQLKDRIAQESDPRVQAGLVDQFEQTERQLGLLDRFLGKGTEITREDKKVAYEMAQYDPRVSTGEMTLPDAYEEALKTMKKARQDLHGKNRIQGIVDDLEAYLTPKAPKKTAGSAEAGGRGPTPAQKDRVTALVNWHMENNPAFGKGAIQAMLQQGQWNRALKTLERMKRIREQKTQKEK